MKHIFVVSTIGGGHGEPSSEIVGYFDECTQELKDDASKYWWSIKQAEVVKYKPDNYKRFR